MSVEITNESDVPVDERALAALARHVLDDLGVNPLAELSVLIVDVEHMTRLHEQWMGERGPTDVLAFPMDELDPARRPGEVPDDLADSPRADADPVLLGDVVLCPAVAIRQASAAGHSFEEELHLLATHGILHLLGYDHGDPDEEREMFGLQARLLDSWRTARAQKGERR